MLRENRVSAAAPGLPDHIQKTVDELMRLSPEEKLTLATNLEQSSDPDLIQFAAAIRRHVATEEGGA